MNDTAHIRTDEILYKTERDLIRIYGKAKKRISEEIAPLMPSLYLDNESATQKERLKYADLHGDKSAIISKTTDIITEANKQAILANNQSNDEIYRTNYLFAIQEIKRQIEASL